MQNYEYKVVPAPMGGTKAKGVKTAEGRFANTLEVLMNKMGAEGWDFQRAETLPSEERSGLMSKSTTFRNVLVFRRDLVAAQVETSPAAAAATAAAASTAAGVATQAAEDPSEAVEQILPEAKIELTDADEGIVEAANDLAETAMDEGVIDRRTDAESASQPLVASRD
jgi:hypothetical protein